jgi:hypothetical protein
MNEAVAWGTSVNTGACNEKMRRTVLGGWLLHSTQPSERGTRPTSARDTLVHSEPKVQCLYFPLEGWTPFQL